MRDAVSFLMIVIGSLLPGAVIGLAIYVMSHSDHVARWWNDKSDKAWKPGRGPERYWGGR